MKLYFVYILECADGTFYTGVTSNLTKRLSEHCSGEHINSYTYKRRPINLVFYTNFTEINYAIAFEKKIKKWSKVKKQALINSEYKKLPNLSKKKF
ncbi:GIY-YIG nuclease family protein [Mesonia maritima]|uniref:Endonuclease n=1 Tax=Mesonia maritima TaxID=1793873 RepID=A0ABU1K8K1_9FLAO|nr:GIY-YIG nuclease family protein [Mesonia maritima]MDR6300827.1 putative endonuclease [Mesonia maritima]